MTADALRPDGESAIRGRGTIDPAPSVRRSQQTAARPASLGLTALDAVALPRAESPANRCHHALTEPGPESDDRAFFVSGSVPRRASTPSPLSPLPRVAVSIETLMARAALGGWPSSTSPRRPPGCRVAAAPGRARSRRRRPPPSGAPGLPALSAPARRRLRTTRRRPAAHCPSAACCEAPAGAHKRRRPLGPPATVSMPIDPVARRCG
jgi:hypothetical protein